MDVPDKSWMRISDRASPEYEEGIDGFLDYALAKLGDPSTIRCPCLKCCNVYYKSRDDVKYDLFRFGILETYTNWHQHGEPYNWYIDKHADEERGGMETLLEDVFLQGENPQSNTDQVEPDIELDNYYKLLEECRAEAYPGCTKYSRLSFLIHLLDLKKNNNWTDTSFTMLLEFMSDFLPEGSRVPKSYYEAKKMLKDLGLNYIKIDACKNDCVLFRKEFENLDKCPTCGESRWKFSTTGDETLSKKRKLVPQKVLRYFPLAPRLKRLYLNEEIASSMIWHSEGRNDDGVLRHPADSLAWKDFDNQHHEFAVETRNVRLGLASDGFVPFAINNNSHSIWPVILVTYNLPPWLCMKSDFFVVSMLIPGPKDPSNDIDVYLAPLIDELKELWERGVTTYDSSKKETFTLRAAVLWTINDFPAYVMLSGWSTKGYLACPICGEKTDSRRLNKGNKICYMGHRRFLPIKHRWRQDKKSFDGKTEKRKAPTAVFGLQLLLQVNQIPSITFGKDPEKRTTKNKNQYLNWKKKSIFFELPYWHKLLIRHNLDVMHIEKNVAENITGIILDSEKSKDNLNARLDLQDMGVRKDLHPKPIFDKNTGDIKKYEYAVGAYTLSREERKEFCKFLLDLKLPYGFSSNIARCVNLQEGKLQNMKTHDWHCLLHRHLPLAIGELLPKNISRPLIEFSAFFRELCSRSLRVPDLERLEKSIVFTLCKLEKIFPPSMFDVMVHLAVHLTSEAKVAGPVQYRWMYAIERFMRILKSLARNKAHPEGSIAEGIIARECLTFCSRYLHNYEMQSNHVSKDHEGDSSEGENNLAVFKHLGSPLRGGKCEFLSMTEWKQATMYVLKNCEEILPFMEEHLELIQCQSMSNVEKIHEESFASWFETRISELYNKGDDMVTQELLYLARCPNKRANKYSAYSINGIRFHTRDEDAFMKTQNSGVWVQGDDGITKKEYYGQILEILELDYQGGNKVVLFRCHWFDVHNKGRGYKVDSDTGFTLVNVDYELCTNATDPYILASQAKMAYYVNDIKDPKWRVVIKTQPRDTYDLPISENNTDFVAENIHMFVQENEDIGGTFIAEGDDILVLRRTDVGVVTEDATTLDPG